MTLMYGNLSYRRKFIRTLSVFALSVLIAAVLFATTPGMRTSRSYIFAAIVAVIFIVQAGYTYARWQSEERGKVD
jgi:hypothetical protein